MDAKFLSIYNEVILDNFNAVLKQNFMFQTQLKFAEEKNKEIGELEKKLANLSSEKTDINDLRTEIEDLKSQLDGKNAIIQSSVNSDQDKHRLQTAVNSQLKEIESLKISVETLNTKQKEQGDYIAQLEEMLPNSKKKKLGIEIPEEQKPTIEESKTPAKEEVNILKFASSGGTF